MDLKAVVGALSEIERKTLAELSAKESPLEEVSRVSGLNIDSVRRAVNWLEQKGLAKVSEQKTKKLVLTEEGKKAQKEGLPEERMLKALPEGEGIYFQDLQKQAGLSQQEFNVALGINKRKNFVLPVKETGSGKIKLQLTEVGKEALGKKSLAFEISPELVGRGLAGEKEEVERKVAITADGEKALALKEFSAERAYNISDPVPELFIGKKQPYVQFLNIIRRKLTELGFTEMEAPMVVHEFYNFDVLFQPQNHPARTWTDTYQLKNPTHGTITHREKVKAVKAAHETGGVSASTGWQYTWLEEIARKVMPTAHGTAHSARQLVKGVQVPGKYFAMARCFRPDVLDATHLIEFNQTEGFIVGEELNFTHLLGMLEQFAKEIAGAKEVKFIPDYYPFTEPSVQLSALHPKLGWVELGGAGMFRPEILENLGIKGQAIAWGIGIDRLAMFRLGVKDIRYLFSDDLNWLRKSKAVVE